MNERVFDIGIIGAGPAGCSTAINLADAGLDIALFEKSPSPGSGKIRPGATKPEILEEFKLPDSVVGTRIKRIIIQSNRKKLVERDVEMVTVNRHSFDKALCSKAKRLGCSLFLGTEINNVQRNKDLWRATSENRNFACKVLVFADGPVSKIRFKQNMGFVPTKNCLITAAANVKTKPSHNTIEIFCNEDVSEIGYVWSMPVGNFANIGLFTHFWVQKSEFRNLIKDALPEQSAGLIDDSPLDISILPCDIAKRLCVKGALAVGDAAGFVSPISGEGIFFALESGKAAAEAIKDPFRRNNFKLDLYEKLVKRSEWFRTLKREAKIVKGLRRSKNPFQKYVKLLAGV